MLSGPWSQPAERGTDLRPLAGLIRLHRHSVSNLLVLGGSAMDRVRVATAFHRQSALRLGPFVVRRCDRKHQQIHAALQRSLSVHDREHEGDPLRVSEGGMLFLDHVECLPPETQRLFLGFLRGLSPARGNGASPSWFGRLAVGSAVDLALEVDCLRFLAPLYDCLDKIRIELEPRIEARSA